MNDRRQAQPSSLMEIAERLGNGQKPAGEEWEVPCEARFRTMLGGASREDAEKIGKAVSKLLAIPGDRSLPLEQRLCAVSLLYQIAQTELPSGERPNGKMIFNALLEIHATCEEDAVLSRIVRCLSSLSNELVLDGDRRDELLRIIGAEMHVHPADLHGCTAHLLCERCTPAGRDSEPSVETGFRAAVKESMKHRPERLGDALTCLERELRQEQVQSKRSWLVVFVYHIGDAQSHPFSPPPYLDRAFDFLLELLELPERESEVVQKWVIRSLCALYQRHEPKRAERLLARLADVFERDGTIITRARIITQLVARRIPGRGALVRKALMNEHYGELRIAALEDLILRDDSRNAWEPGSEVGMRQGASRALTLQERLLELLQNPDIADHASSPDPTRELGGSDEKLGGVANLAWQEAMLVNQAIQALEWNSPTDAAQAQVRHNLCYRLRELVRGPGGTAVADAAVANAAPSPGSAKEQPPETAELALSTQSATSLAKLAGRERAMIWLVEDAVSDGHANRARGTKVEDSPSECDEPEERRRIADAIRFVAPREGVKAIERRRGAEPRGESGLENLLESIASESATNALMARYRHIVKQQDRDVEAKLRIVRDELTRSYRRSKWMSRAGFWVGLSLLSLGLIVTLGGAEAASGTGWPSALGGISAVFGVAFLTAALGIDGWRRKDSNEQLERRWTTATEWLSVVGAALLAAASVLLVLLISNLPDDESTRRQLGAGLMSGGLLSFLLPLLANSSKRIERAAVGLARGQMAHCMFEIQMAQLDCLFSKRMDEIEEESEARLEETNVRQIIQELREAANAVRASADMLAGPPA